MGIFKEIQIHREQEELSQLINVGSCGLHIIHGAFQTGATTTWCNIKGTLKAIYKLLFDSPARRADCISVTGSMLFPFSFCATRWEEDKKLLIGQWKFGLIHARLLTHGKN